MQLPEPYDHWIYECEDIVVEPRAHRFERSGQPVLVEPKAYAVLVVLLEQAGLMVDKNTLLDAGWGHRNVTPGVLSHAISQLRHALGDSAAHPQYIATVNCLGYRFVGAVSRRLVHSALLTAPVREASHHDAAVIDADALQAGLLPVKKERRILPDRRTVPDRRILSDRRKLPDRRDKPVE